MSVLVQNSVRRTLSATALNAIRVIVLLIPLSCLGAYLGGVRGVFWGRLATDVTVGVLGVLWVRRMLGRAVMTSPVVGGPPHGCSQTAN